MTRIMTYALVMVIFVGYSVSLFAQTQKEQKVVESTELTKPAKNKKTKNQDEEKTLLIEVTSNKRKENIQDVPASVSAFGSAELEDRRIETVTDTADLVPNYTVANWGTGFAFHSMRGQSNISNYSNPIGIYMDDVPLTAAGNYMGMNLALFDMERIEVLRGAQGNLYGSNSAGGVINIITRKPQNYWQGKATAGFGNYDRRDFKASVGGAIVKDKFYAQVSGMYKKQNAFIRKKEQEPLDSSTAGMRLRLIYTPLENLELDLSSQLNDQSFDLMGMVRKDKYPNMFQIASTKPDMNKTFSNLNSLQIKYSHNIFEMNSITSFHYSNSVLKTDMWLFGFNGSVIHMMAQLPPPNGYGITGGCPSCVGKDVYANTYFKDSTWTQEFRFVSTQDLPLKWMTGIFYANDKNKISNDYTLMKKIDRAVETNSFSWFGNIAYTFIKKITLGFGLRYDLNHKQLDYSQRDHILKAIVADFKRKKMTHSVSPKFTFDYKVHPTSLLYVSVARGVKNGMFAGEPTKAETAFLSPEYTWTYEGGLKTNFYNNRIFFNINGFYTQMTNVQVFYFVGNVHTYKNGGRAHSAGTELEFIARPVQGLDISLTAGYLFSAFTKHEVKANDGNALPFAPVYQVGLWLQYTSPIGIYAGFGLNANGKTYYDDANKFSQKDYLTMKGKIGYISNHFSVDLWMENIANQKYWAYLVDFQGKIGGIPGSPRTFGMSVSGYF